MTRKEALTQYEIEREEVMKKVGGLAGNGRVMDDVNHDLAERRTKILKLVDEPDDQMWRAAQMCKPPDIEINGKLIYPSAFAIIEIHKCRVEATIEWRYDLGYDASGWPLGCLIASEWWDAGMFKTEEGTSLAIRT